MIVEYYDKDGRLWFGGRRSLPSGDTVRTDIFGGYAPYARSILIIGKAILFLGEYILYYHVMYHHLEMLGTKVG